MATINVDGSAARLLANKTLAAAGYCLHYCWLAISQGVVHYITGGAGSAYATWLAVPADHQHKNRDVPKDFPAFLGPKLLSKAGDVIISNGDGTFTATDWPKSRQVGICTLEQREKQTGRKFVGWASSMGGHELVSTSTAGETGTPITTKRKVNPVLSIHRILREGVGSFIMYTSATQVSLSRELSLLSEKDRAFEMDAASRIAVAVGLPAEIPTLDDTSYNGWYLRNLLAFAAAGMPGDFPLAPGHPYDAIAARGVAGALEIRPAAFSFTGTATPTK